MNTSAKKKGIIVSHTHWDRAWYLPFEVFRFRLVKMIDRLIDLLNRDPSFACFVLDGQTVLLEDYLEIRPEKADELMKLISSSRLQIGPWYVLPDLFLVSGESVIRNLQIGHKMTEQWGGKMDVGYVPDPFGHIAQLPQILLGFHISNFVFMRGMPEEILTQNSLLFNWVAPDGSTVLAYYLKDGYLNASNLGYTKSIGRYDLMIPDVEEASKQTKKAIESLTEYDPQNIILLNNGMDHMPEQPELPSLIEQLNGLNGEIELKHGSFSDFLTQVDSSDIELTYSGNLLGNPDHPILLSVYSTRVYLKQQNQQCQSILEKIAEPISIVQEVLTGISSSQAILNYSWKTLLKNHPHDDICGCSHDGVHNDNEVRFRQVLENGENIFTDALENLSKTGFQTLEKDQKNQRFEEVFVFNPHPFEHTRWIETEVVFPNSYGEEEEVLDAFDLTAVDHSGDEIEIEVIETKAPYLKAEFIQFTWGRLYSVRFKVTAPPLGYVLIRLSETATPLSSEVSSTTEKKIDTKKFEITWDKDSIHVFDKELKHTFNNAIRFEYVQDNGDTYSFSRASKEWYSTLYKVEQGVHSHCLDAHFHLYIPGDLSREKEVNIPITVSIDYSNEDRLEFQINYTNTAKNGRLRVLFPIGFKASSSIADGHFTFYENEKAPELSPSEHKEKYDAYPGELNYPTHFQGDFTVVEGTLFNTWVANRGLNEYELVEIDDTTHVAITLHRAVGFLSVSNGSIRRPHAGPKVEVPEAQCLRPIVAHLAWGTTKQNRYEIAKKAGTFSHPLKARQLPVLQGKPKEGLIPRRAGFLSIPDLRVRLSCFKYSDQGKEIILRIFNSSTEFIRTEAQFHEEISAFCTTDLYERWNEKSTFYPESSNLPIAINPNQILTYRIRLRDTT